MENKDIKIKTSNPTYTYADKNTKDWWDKLTSEEQLQCYLRMKQENKYNADGLNRITNHLLGNDWYSTYWNTEDIVNDIVSQISTKYPNVNYSWKRTWERIKNAINDYIHLR